MKKKKYLNGSRELAVAEKPITKKGMGNFGAQDEKENNKKKNLLLIRVEPRNVTFVPSIC